MLSFHLLKCANLQLLLCEVCELPRIWVENKARRVISGMNLILRVCSGTHGVP